MKKIALCNIDLVDVIKETVKNKQTILIEADTISQIGDADTIKVDHTYEIIDGKGKTVIPGLIDAHLHLLQSGVDDFLKPYKEGFSKKINRHLMRNLKSGITTVRNMPGGQNLKVHKVRNDINQGKRIGPRILSSGPALSAPYGYFSTKMFFPFPAFFRWVFKHLYRVTSLSIDVASKEEAITAVKRLKAHNVDFIKTTTTGAFIPYNNDKTIVDALKQKGMKPSIINAEMKPEILEVIVNEAHKQELKVAAHTVYYPSDFHYAATLGIDSLEHTPFGEIDDETFDIMIKNQVYWVPTAFAPMNYLKIIEDDDYYDHVMKDLPPAFFKLGKQTINTVKQQLEQFDPLQAKMIEDLKQLINHYIPYNIKRASKKGVMIVAAVDGGASGAGYVPHGMLHEELKLYTHLGMSPIESLKTATINPANLLGVANECGSIEIGKKADLVICDQNPCDNINNLNTINTVIVKGNIIKIDTV